MAALIAILKAVRLVTQRELSTLWSIKVNNFFLFVLLLAYGAGESGLEPVSAEPLILLLGFLLLFPASSDPLAKIPPSRMTLWPLETLDRISLRLTSLALSPVLWMMFAIFLKSAKMAGPLWFLAYAVMTQVALLGGARLVRYAPSWNPLRHIPRFPGRCGGLIHNNLREILCLLDPYLGLMVALGGAYYSFLTPRPDPSAASVISILIALAMSTYAQSLFALDFGSGITRYRLLPLRGWEILLAKDVAFLLVLFVLVLPFHIASGMTFGLVALALGHHSSIFQRIPQKRWRFAAGRLLPVGAAQFAGGVAAGFAEKEYGIAVPAAAAALWLLSLVFCGHQWERT